MKILYDHQMFSIQRFGGITKYFCEMISNLPPEHRFELALISSDNYHLKENRRTFGKMDVLPERDFRKKQVFRDFIYTINGQYSQYKISKNRFDIFHPTFYNNYFFKKLKKPYVITVHDLIEFRFQNASAHSASVRPQMETAIKNADRVIAISENTKNDINDILGIPRERIDVVYHGYNMPGSAIKENEYGRYILFVGNRVRYKNFSTLSKALSVLFEEDTELSLVCVGSPFDAEEVATLKGLGIVDRSVAVNVSEDLLNTLYSHALAFVYPSLYEGFGMPILEAFANNCPVCLSNSSSFPEVAGNAGAYFDPLDVDSMLEVIQKVIYDKCFSKSLVEAGRMRLKEFSWKKTATQTVACYQKAIG